MPPRFVCVKVLMLIVTLEYVYNLHVIPERTAVNFVTKNYFESCKYSIKKYGRKSAYYMNIELMVVRKADNNVTLHAYFNEYLHNEYRRSFVEFHYKICDLLKNDPYIGGAFAKAGVRCPLMPGMLMLWNVTVPSENFPYVWPFEKGRVDFNFTSTATGELLLSTSLFASFKK